MWTSVGWASSHCASMHSGSAWPFVQKRTLAVSLACLGNYVLRLIATQMSEYHVCPRPGCLRQFPTAGSTLKHLQSEASGLCHTWFLSRNLQSELSDSHSSDDDIPSSSSSVDSRRQYKNALAHLSEDSDDKTGGSSQVSSDDD